MDITAHYRPSPRTDNDIAVIYSIENMDKKQILQ